jgi:hypothetical protein
MTFRSSMIPCEGRFLKSRNRKDMKGTKDMKKGKS